MKKLLLILVILTGILIFLICHLDYESHRDTINKSDSKKNFSESVTDYTDNNTVNIIPYNDKTDDDNSIINENSGFTMCIRGNELQNGYNDFSDDRAFVNLDSAEPVICCIDTSGNPVYMIQGFSAGYRCENGALQVGNEQKVEMIDRNGNIIYAFYPEDTDTLQQIIIGYGGGYTIFAERTIGFENSEPVYFLISPDGSKMSLDTEIYGYGTEKREHCKYLGSGIFQFQSNLLQNLYYNANTKTFLSLDGFGENMKFTRCDLQGYSLSFGSLGSYIQQFKEQPYGLPLQEAFEFDDGIAFLGEREYYHNNESYLLYSDGTTKVVSGYDMVNWKGENDKGSWAVECNNFMFNYYDGYFYNLRNDTIVTDNEMIGHVMEVFVNENRNVAFLASGDDGNFYYKVVDENGSVIIPLTVLPENNMSVSFFGIGYIFFKNDSTQFIVSLNDGTAVTRPCSEGIVLSDFHEGWARYSHNNDQYTNYISESGSFMFSCNEHNIPIIFIDDNVPIIN